MGFWKVAGRMAFGGAVLGAAGFIAYQSARMQNRQVKAPARTPGQVFADPSLWGTVGTLPEEPAPAAPVEPVEPPVTKAVVKKAPAKKTVAKKAPATKAVAKKAPATKAVAKKTPAKKTVAKKEQP